MQVELMPLVHRLARRQLAQRGARARTLVVRGHAIHLVDLPGAGSGPPVALLHGLGSSALTFAQIIPGLAQLSSRVLAADLPGSGFSPPAAPPPGIDACVDLLEALYERELDRPALVVGNSLGGAMAVELAARRPDLAAALVLVAPAGARVPDAEFQALLTRMQPATWAEGRAMLKRLYHRAPPLVAELLAHDMRVGFGRANVRELLHGKRRSDFLEPEVLAKLTMPTLLLWGRSERVLPYGGIDYFRAHLPKHAVVEEVEGFGHAPHLDAPRALVERIGRFVSGLNAPGGAASKPAEPRRTP